MAAILAIIIGVIIAWLDIFFMASAPAAIKISFVTLAVVAYFVKNRPQQSLIAVLSAAVAGDLIVPLSFFGGRLIGYSLLFTACRFLVDSFFPVNRLGAVWMLTFILALAAKIAALFDIFFIYWWRGENAASLLALENFGYILAASVSTAIAMAAIVYLFSRFDHLARRWFLIRH